MYFFYYFYAFRKKKYEDEIKTLNNQHKKEVASLLQEKQGILQR